MFNYLDKNGFAKILDDKAYFAQLQAGKIINHIVININHAIKENIAELYSIPDYNDVNGLSENELEVLAIIRKKDYQSIWITKKNGAIDMVEGVERIEGERRIIDLLKQGKYQNIEVKQSNGKVVCINRTFRKKLKK